MKDFNRDDIDWEEYFAAKKRMEQRFHLFLRISGFLFWLYILLDSVVYNHYSFMTLLSIPCLISFVYLIKEYI